MNANVLRIAGSSVLRKQIIAITGFGLVIFIIMHLAGNLLLFAGPDAFNGYSQKLHDLGIWLWVARLGLIATALIHVGLTIQLIIENRASRGGTYAEYRSHGNRRWAARTMKYSGVLLIFFLVLHLYDFTFANLQGPQSVIPGVNNDESLGLFGVVWFSFNQSWRNLIYIAAMIALGMHLSHAIQSLFQTFGFHHQTSTPWIRRLSVAAGVIIAIAFSIIPIYVLIADQPPGV